jgi:hypothetical protein
MSALTNTAVLQQILGAEGLRFSSEAGSGFPQSDVTTLSFMDGDSMPWCMFIVSYPDMAFLRFYSHIGPPLQSNVQFTYLMELINEINATLLFESSVDFWRASSVVRFKSAFRGVGRGLPAAEAQEAIRAHGNRSIYLHNLLKLCYVTPQVSPQTAVRQHARTAASKSRLNEPPTFV